MSNNNDIINYLLWFAGIASSGGIAAYVYKRQKKDAKPFEEQVIETLDNNLEQSFRNGVRDINIIYTLNEIKEKLESISDQNILEERLISIEKELKNINNKNLPINEVFEYKSLGDRWSELQINKHNFSVLDNNGRISTNKIQSAHSSLFPSNFAWAGKLRKEHVFIIENFGTCLQVIDAVSAETKLDTIPPEDIPENLEKLCQYWNENIEAYTQANNTIKLNSVAQFHHEFELLHPFLDGNGRLGRIIINEQLSYLFNQRIIFEPNREEYYAALRLMNMNEKSRLLNIIQEQLVESGINF